MFSAWSDGGAQTHTVTAFPGATFTAAIVSQYLLTTAVSGNGSLAMSPTSPDGYYGSNVVVTLTATPGAGWQFRAWNLLPATNNQLEVLMSGPVSVTAYFGVTPVATSALHFVPVTPCRVADTRVGNGFTGSFGPPTMAGNSTRSFPVPQSSCGIPASAQAYSMNITAVPTGKLTYLSTWPAGQSQPVVSTLNSFTGRVVANAALVPAGTNGAISVFVTDPADVIIDINGYFTSGYGLAFYPVTPCRVADTRGYGFAGSFGPPSLSAGSFRSFPIAQSSCGIPSTAQAYALNLTVAPPGPLAYLAAWPAGQTQPDVSTLNSYDGQVVANAAIVPAGSNGSIDVYVSNTTDAIIDINGYFDAPGASGALSFYTAPPCRVADTRGNGFTAPLGPPGMSGNSYRSFPVIASLCAIPSTAQAYSLNITVAPAGPLTYLKAFGPLTQTNFSTLNSLDGRVVANAAIVPSSGGAVNVYVSNATDVIIDTNGYFAP